MRGTGFDAWSVTLRELKRARTGGKMGGSIMETGSFTRGVAFTGLNYRPMCAISSTAVIDILNLSRPFGFTRR